MLYFLFYHDYAHKSEPGDYGDTVAYLSITLSNLKWLICGFHT